MISVDALEAGIVLEEVEEGDLRVAVEGSAGHTEHHEGEEELQHNPF